MPEEARLAAAAFPLPGSLVAVEPHGSGNIHRTYLARCRTEAGPRRFILQRLNRRALLEPEESMERLVRLLGHLRSAEPDPRRGLSLLRARDGASHWRAPDGEVWRAFDFIEGTTTRDVIAGPEEAFETARAFGRFLSRLRDLPAWGARPALHFHDTPKRFLQFERAAAADASSRAAGARREIDFVLGRKQWASVLTGPFEAGELPERMIHNDTKVNNVLFDAETGEGLCVIDLDTVMPGLTLYDFGDLARSGVCAAPEDEEDLAKVALRPAVFAELARGFLAGSGELLGRAERAYLAASARVIAFELGMRFLTDHLSGDGYFLTSRPGQNLARCRTQLRLAELFEGAEGELNRLVDRL